MANILKYKSWRNSNAHTFCVNKNGAKGSVSRRKKHLRRQLRRKLKKANDEDGHNLLVRGYDWT